MVYYPVNLDIAGRRCVVVGGGQVAERKVERLVECGARVAVLSRRLTARLADMARAGTVEHVDSEYEPSKLDGAMLVIGATDREDVNDAVSRECRPGASWSTSWTTRSAATSSCRRSSSGAT
jgi:Siroheme synthase (precorrin-2 oxidase/ferrochelatase domain)